MKRTIFLLAAGILCLAACKTEPDLPGDPHVSLVNPFIGIWNAGGEYWQFRTDGTGGRAATTAGTFSNDFSFFVYAGQDVRTTPSAGSLVTLDDSGGASSITVTRYEFSIAGNKATLTGKSPGSSAKTLQRVSGSPQALNLANSLVGEWSAVWTGTHGDNNTWSLKYRADGTVKTYHHGMHQFENAYALRGNTLVIFGDWRFSDPQGLGDTITATFHPNQNGTWAITEIQTDPAPANWTYTKVAAAKWK